MVLETRELTESWSISDSVGRIYKARRVISETAYSITETLARIYKARRTLGGSRFANQSTDGPATNFRWSDGFLRFGLKITLRGEVVKGNVKFKIYRVGGSPWVSSLRCHVVRGPFTGAFNSANILETAPEIYNYIDYSTFVFIDANFTFQGNYSALSEDVAVVLSANIASGVSYVGTSSTSVGTQIGTLTSNENWTESIGTTAWAEIPVAADLYSITETLTRTAKFFRTIAETSYSILETLARRYKAIRSIPSTIATFLYDAYTGFTPTNGGNLFGNCSWQGVGRRQGVKITLVNQVVKGVVTVNIQRNTVGGVPFGGEITCSVVRGPFTDAFDSSKIIETAPETYDGSKSDDATFTFLGNYAPLNEDVVVLVSGIGIGNEFNQGTSICSPADVPSGSGMGINTSSVWASMADRYMKIPVVYLEGFAISETLNRTYKARRVLTETLTWLDSVIRRAKLYRTMTETLTWLDSVARRLKATRTMTEAYSFLDSVARIYTQRAPFVGTKNELVKRLQNFRIHMSGNQGIPTTKEEQRARKIPKRKGFWSRWNEPDV